MRSSGNGPFGVLLLAAPLVAVPMLAIFGIPQFAPGVDAGSVTEQEEVGFEDEADSPRASKNRRRSNADDLFSPLDELADEAADEGEVAETDDWNPPEEALKGYRMAPPEEQFADSSSSEEWFDKSREQEHGDENPDEFDRGEAREGLKNRREEKEDEDYDRSEKSRRDGRDSKSVNPPRELEFGHSGDQRPEEQLTAEDEAFVDSNPRKGKDGSIVVEEFSWRQASRRLRELGDNVKHYFDYDIEKETYVFHCELSPLDDPGVVQEFQAQGHEPLTTVREVIKQVERWSKNRESSLARSEKQTTNRSR